MPKGKRANNESSLSIVSISGTLYTSSRDIADLIGKDHKNLIRDIQRYIQVLKKSIELKVEPNEYFMNSTYTDSIGRTLPCYLCTRKGCDLIAHKLTGEKGILFSAKYIDRFYEMEKRLLERSAPVWKSVRQAAKDIRKQEADTIKCLVDYAKAQGSTHADRYYSSFSRLANKAIGITERDTATMEQLVNLQTVERIIAKTIQAGIESGRPYHDIYQECRRSVEQFRAAACLTQA